jgi:hypothetical protein
MLKNPAVLGLATVSEIMTRAARVVIPPPLKKILYF